MDSINLGIKFVKGWEPAPEPVPVSDTSGLNNVTDNLTQTGDLMIFAIIALAVIAAAFVAGFIYLRKKQLVTGAHTSNSPLAVLSFRSMDLRSKVCVISAAVITLTCIVLTCFSVFAHADKITGTASPLVPDKNIITATVAEDGTITCDTCNLTNTDVLSKYTVDKSIVSVNADFSAIDSLKEASLNISGFNGTVFSGKATGVDYVPENLTALEPSVATALSFKIELVDSSIVEQLFDAQVFNVSLTPKQYFTPDTETNLNYQVCIWGFGEDQVGASGKETAAITFGPATGATNDCLDVDRHDTHLLGKHCIHEDSWDEIAYHCQNGEAHLYSECLADDGAGCTKSVPLNLNPTIGTMPTTGKQYCSYLNTTINSDYKKWNKNVDPYVSTHEREDWTISRMRATLNGVDNMGKFTPSTYADPGSCLNSTSCLLSCFPANLANSIKSKYYQAPKEWDKSKPYTISQSDFVSDKLWLLSAEEVWAQSDAEEKLEFIEHFRSQYKKKSNEGITYKSRASNVFFDETGSSEEKVWLRSPKLSQNAHVARVDKFGACGNQEVNFEYGIAPCFCL